MNRRHFLERVSGAAACAACTGLALPLSGCLGFHYVTSAIQGGSIVVRKADIGSTPFVLVEAPDGLQPVYLYRDDTGGFAAVSTRCTHRGCTVEPVAGHLVCPCHGSEYTNRGEVLKGPAERPLARYPVREDGDALLIAWSPNR